MTAVSRDMLDDLRAKAVQARDAQCGWPRESPDVVLQLLDHVDALEATIARVRELADEWDEVDGNGLDSAVQSIRLSIAVAELRAVLSEGAELTHAYGAAGLLVCGLETGGAISRHDGYRGPDRRSTTHGDRVTCPDCRAVLSDGADDGEPTDEQVMEAFGDAG